MQRLAAQRRIAPRPAADFAAIDLALSQRQWGDIGSAVSPMIFEAASASTPINWLEPRRGLRNVPPLKFQCFAEFPLR